MRKRFFRTFLAALLIASLMSVPAFAEGGVVTGLEVNLRSGPGMEYRILDNLRQGSVVTVVDSSSDSWWAVTYEGTFGYMAANLLSLTGNTPVKVTVSSGSGHINAMYVRFRSAPNAGADVIAEYNTGKELTITGNSGDWTACTIDGQSGYIYSEFITVDSNGATVIVDQAEEQAAEQPAAAVTDLVTPDAQQSAEAKAASDLVTPDPRQNTETKAEEAAPAPILNAQGQSGYVDGDYVCFRAGASQGSVVIDTYNRGKVLTVTGSTENGWVPCVIDGASGYIASQYVKTDAQTPAASAEPAPETKAEPETKTEPETKPEPETKAETKPEPTRVESTVKETQVEPVTGYITGNYVRFRKAPSMSSDLLGDLFYGNAVTITGYAGDWTAVTYEGEPGYVYSSFVSEKEPVKTKEQSEEKKPKKALVTGQDIVDFALQYVGLNYLWGGISPETGFDCSGFTSYVYGHFGYELNRVACDQAVNGVHVDASKLQPGDLLCFYSGGSYIGHVGIYIGNNNFVHAANSASGLIISSLDGYYSTRGFEARRIL